MYEETVGMLEGGADPRSDRLLNRSQIASATAMPRSRTRHDLHKHPHYYRIRNHPIDFLVDRSKAFAGDSADYDPRHPPLVTPGLDPAGGGRRRTAETAARRR